MTARQIQFVRGNTLCVSHYVGPVGSVAVNTDDWSVYIQDGVTPGGHMVSGSGTYGNIDVHAYLSEFDGDIVPSTNSVYSLGSISNQWRDLFLSNASIYFDGVQLTVDAAKNLTIDGNELASVDYVNTTLANVTAYDQSLNTHDNVKFANIAISSWGNIGAPSGPGISIVTNQDAGGNFSLVGIGNTAGGLSGFVATVLNGSDSTFTTVQSNDGQGNLSLWVFNSDGRLTLPATNSGPATISWPGSDLQLIGTIGGGNLLIAGGINLDFDSRIYKSSATTIILTPNAVNATTGISFDDNVVAKVYSGANVELWTNGEVGPNQIWIFDESGNVTFPDGSVQPTAYNNAAVSAYLASVTPQTFGDSVLVSGNLTVQGNIFFNGNVTLISTENLVVNDNIIYLAESNPSNSLDIGIVGNFTNEEGYQHTGFVRQAGTRIWRLFSNVRAEPGATVDFSDAVYDDVQVGSILSPTIDLLNANAAIQQGLIDGLEANVGAQSLDIQSLFSNSYQQQGLIGNLQASSYSNVNAAAYLTVNGYLTTAEANLANYAWNTNISAVYGNVDVAAYLNTNNYLTNAGANLSLYAWNANVITANVGMKGYIDQANSIQSAQIANLSNVMYTNANVQAYSLVWASDLRPNANVTYNIGSATARWNAVHANTVNSTANIYSGTDLVAQANVWAQGGNFRTGSSNVFLANTTPTTAWAFGNAATINIGAAASLTTFGSGTGNISGLVNGFAIGYRDIPQVSWNANATINTSDSGKHYYTTSSGNLTLTVANNATQAFSIGAAINIINQGTGTMTVAPASGVSLYLAGNSTSASRTISSYGLATITKVATDTWFIVGAGVT